MTEAAAAPSSIVTVAAVITRADGTVEDLGVIASSDPAGPGHVERHDADTFTPPKEAPDGR